MPEKNTKTVRLLIADDDASIREKICECVKDTVYEVIAQADNGMSAVESARTANADVAMLDIVMPMMDGMTASGIMMEEGTVHCTVMLTSFETDDYVEAAVNKGVESYITKPFTREQLLSVLDMSCAQSKERYLLKRECTNLKKKLDSKEIIAKAKVIVMEERSVDENDAYIYLRELSKRKNISVETVAEMIIAKEESRS